MANPSPPISASPAPEGSAAMPPVAAESPPANPSPRGDETGASVADILARAADLIEPEGAWIQGGYGTGGLTGLPTCMGGAVNIASGRRPWETLRQCPAVRFINGFVGEIGVGPWNDAPERTQAEVVAKLREASNIARNGEDRG